MMKAIARTILARGALRTCAVDGLPRSGPRAGMRGAAALRRKGREEGAAALRGAPAKDAARRRSDHDGGHFGQYGGDIITLVRGRGTSATSRPMPISVSSDTTEAGPRARHPRNLRHQGRPHLHFTLREGHRWSDGHPFTTEDFRYYWEDVAQNKELSPAGLPEFMIVDGKPPAFEVCRRAHDPLFLGQAEPALPAAARRTHRSRTFPARALPQEVPRQVRRQGGTRRGGEEAEAEVLGGAPQPPRRRQGAHQSGPADPADLARRSTPRRRTASSSSAIRIITASTRTAGSFPTSTGRHGRRGQPGSSPRRRMPARPTCSSAASP